MRKWRLRTLVRSWEILFTSDGLFIKLTNTFSDIVVKLVANILPNRTRRVVLARCSTCIFNLRRKKIRVYFEYS